MDTIFDIRREQIRDLAPETAVRLFRDLLWAEARRVGVPISAVQISTWINVPDGGVDGSVLETAADLAGGSGLIKPGHTGYQIKAGTSFVPWQDAEIKRELFGKKHPSKENLGSRVRACLDQQGTYVLVCFGQDLIDEQRSQAEGALKYYFEQCGYDNSKVEVWGQGTIIGYLQVYPSLILQLRTFDEFKFQTHPSWYQQDDMRKEFKAGQAQEDFIRNIRTELQRKDEALHIRICGEPGVGKTRLVLEATSTEDLSPLVLYCDSAEKFVDSQLLNEIIKEDNLFAVLLVVDECPPDNSNYVWNKLKHLGSRIKLITVYSEYDPTSGNIVYYDVPPLEKEQVSAIIQDYGVQKDQADRWSDICSGSPRMAHVIGGNLKTNPEDVLKTPDTVNVWDRYITGGDDPQDEDVRQRKTLLRHVALFKKFGFGKAVIEETRALARIVEEADKQITLARFQEIVKKLRERRILQGETTLYITPKALHIQLWKDWWETYGAAFDFKEFSKKLPASLREWFYEMFRYAKESEAASKIVQELLGENGPFQKEDYLLTKGGSDFFLALTEANPEAALKCLQATLGTLSKEDLIQFGEGRRSVIWALERIVIWRDLFSGAARILLQLGEAENETYGNNASGVFASLFSPAPGSVAPTQASPEERFPVLQGALNSDSKQARLLAIRACGVALGTHFYRMVGAEYQGLREVPLWRPKSREEITDAYRRVWRLIYGRLPDLPADEQKTARGVLMESTRTLAAIPQLADLIIDDISSLADAPYGDRSEIIQTAEAILHYDSKNFAPRLQQKWQELRDRLVGNDFGSLMRRYVGMDLLEDRVDLDGHAIDKAKQPINSLVEQIVAENSIIEPVLPWLVTDQARNGFRFGYELGRKDSRLALLPRLLDAQRKASGSEDERVYFLSGYLRALLERDALGWEDLLDELAQDHKLAKWIAELTWRSGLSERAAIRILSLAENDVLHAGDFRIFGLGSAVKDLPEPIFIRWIEFLLRCPAEYAGSIALDLYHFFYLRMTAPYQLPRDLTLQVLTNPSLFRAPQQAPRDQMDDFHWKEIGNAFVEIFPDDAPRLLDIAFEHFGEDGTIAGGFHPQALQVLNRITEKHPEEVWKLVAKYLGPPLDARAFHIKEWLRGAAFFDEQQGALVSFAKELVWQWVDEDVDKRAWYLATFVPKALFRRQDATCWATELLVRYGEREDVRRNLQANFSTEGWSGPASVHLENKKKMLLEFREAEDNSNVKRWIDEYVASLDETIEIERIREEREG